MEPIEETETIDIMTACPYCLAALTIKCERTDISFVKNCLHCKKDFVVKVGIQIKAFIYKLEESKQILTIKV